MDEKLNKRLPYSVPDGFFDVMEANVMAKIKADAGINVGGDKADTQMRDKQYRKTTTHTHHQPEHLGYGGIAAATLHDILPKHKNGAANQRHGEH